MSAPTAARHRQARGRAAAVLASLAALLVLAVAVAPVFASGTGATAAGALLGRAFTARAEAYPAETAPGTNDTSLGGRPYGVRASVANPPATAHALAATADLGTIENQTNAQGPRAEADSSLANLPRDQAADPGGGGYLVAHADSAPTARSSARGTSVPIGAGTASGAESTALADGSGAALLAEVHTVAHRVVIGPLEIAESRFDAVSSTTGVAGGANASGRVTVSGATVNGTPVVIDGDGVHVDKTLVPAAQVSELTKAVSDALATGGYLDVRVVQPAVGVSKDGTEAFVRGGGVRVRMTNNDPRQRYFIEQTLTGGRAEVFAGSPSGADVEGVTAGGDAGSAPAPEPLDSGGGSPLAVPALGNPGGGPGPGAAAPSAGRVRLVARSSEAALQGAWRGARWIALAGAGLLAGAAAVAALAPLVPARRSIASAAGQLADRYLRG